MSFKSLKVQRVGLTRRGFEKLWRMKEMMVDIKSYDGLDRSTYPSNPEQRKKLFASPLKPEKEICSRFRIR